MLDAGSKAEDLTAKQNALAVQLVAATKKAELLKIELDHARQELDMTVEQKKRLADIAGTLKAQSEAQLAEHEVLFCQAYLLSFDFFFFSLLVPSDGCAEIAAATA